MRNALLILFLALAAAPVEAAAPSPERRAEARIEARLLERLGKIPGIELRADDPLRLAARELALAEAARLDVDPHEFLRQSLSRRSLLDPFPYVFTAAAPLAEVDSVADRVARALGRLSARERRLYTHMAAGLVLREERRYLFWRDRSAAIAVLVTQRALTYAPFPPAATPGERFVLEGEVHPPFRAPEVWLTRPDGDAVLLDNLSFEPGRFRAWVALDRAPGEYQIEVLGRDDMGPRVLGLGSVYARHPGQPTPHERLLAAIASGHAERAAARRPVPPQDVRSAEAHLLALINRDRRRAGLVPLTPDSLLAAMARAHSQDMVENDFFAHVSPHTGRLSERATARGVRFRRLAENIAVHGDVARAESALLRSPGHRVHILDPEFTRVGVGVAVTRDADGGARVYVTQNFMVPDP